MTEITLIAFAPDPEPEWCPVCNFYFCQCGK